MRSQWVEGRYLCRLSPRQVLHAYPLYCPACRPITNQVKRLLAHRDLWEQAKHHRTSQARMGFPDGVIADIYDGQAYKNLTAKLESEGRPLQPCDMVFTLHTDGFLPFKDDARYSVWPLVLCPVNFPPWMR